MLSYPRITEKHNFRSVTTANELIRKLYPDLVNHLTQQNLLPDTMILVYDKYLLNHIVKTYGGKPIKLFTGDSYNLTKLYKTIITGNFGIGGPAVANIIELYIALGIKTYYTFGFAGSISKDIEIGDLIICNSVIPDDGVSQHYIGNVLEINAKPGIVEKLTSRALKENIPVKIGKIWSTAAIFRETVEEIQYMQKENVCAVDMEAATLLSIGQLYGVNIGIVMVISDKLSNFKWQLDMKKSKEAMKKLSNSIILCT